MRKSTFVAIIFALGLASPALAQMTGKPMMGQGMHGGHAMPMGMGMEPMGMLGGPRVVCGVDLGALGLSAEALEALEDKRFELRKTVIRKRAELEILRLELHRAVEDRGFDLAAAQKKAQAMAEIQAELHAVHLGLLHEMAAKLTDEQWQKLQQEKKAMMMPMMRGREMMRGRHQQGGLMMQPGEGGGAGYHHGAHKEAEEFFKQQ